MFISGLFKDMNAVLKQKFARRSAIESHMSHMKAAEKRRRHRLKGRIGEMKSYFMRIWR